MSESIIVNARKHADDPVQEHIREQKSVWNKATSNLISKLIAFKRGLNGRGDPRVGLPPSKIHEPIPNEIGSYLSSIADDYVGIINGAEEIIRAQKSYADSRKNAADDGLISEASWWGSQFWAKYIGLKGKDKVYLKRMINSCVSLKKYLLDLENILSSGYDNAMYDARGLIINLSLPYDNLVTAYDTMLLKNYKKELEPSVTTKPTYQSGPAIPPAPEEDQKNEPDKIIFDRNEIKRIRKDRLPANVILAKLQNKVTPEKYTDLENLYFKLNESNIPHLKSTALKDEKQKSERNAGFADYINAYNELLSQANIAFNMNETSFSDMLNKMQPEQTVGKVAHNVLTRKLKRFLLENKPGFLQSQEERDINDKKVVIIKEGIIPALESLNSLLNFIEEPGANIVEINKLVDEFIANMVMIIENILLLIGKHNTRAGEESRKKNKLIEKVDASDIAKIKKILFSMQSRLAKTNKIRKPNDFISNIDENVIDFFRELE